MYTKHITKSFLDINKVEELAKEAFPPEEYLAPSILIDMADKNEVEFLGLYEKNDFVGFMVVKVYKNMTYLFFLAISSLFRSGGYGSSALNILKEMYNGKQHVVDFEMVTRSATNYEQRLNRLKFYLKNDYKDTGKIISYKNVDYEIFCTDDDFDFQTFIELMKDLEIQGFEPKYSDKI